MRLDVNDSIVIMKCNMQHPFHHRKVCTAMPETSETKDFFHHFVATLCVTPKSFKIFKSGPRLFALGCEAAGLKGEAAASQKKQVENAADALPRMMISEENS